MSTESEAPRPRILRPRPLAAALVLLAIGNLGFGLGGPGFLNGNECLYVEAAREMAAGGNPIVPTLDGLPYPEKPPLMQWLLVIAMATGGLNEVAARSVSVLASAGLALALVPLSSLLRFGDGWVAAYVYLTSLGVMLLSSVAMPDALLTGLFGAGCLGFGAALRTGRKDLLRLAAAALGLACLTKGLMPLGLFALVLIAYGAVERADRGSVFRLWRDVVAWLILLAPLAIWVVAAEWNVPGAARRFIIDEHELRFLGLREPHDYYSGSPFYYVPRLLLFAFPWVGVLAFGASGHASKQGDERTKRFLWSCVAVPFAFFSLSEAKANYYISVCLPPLALLASDSIATLTASPRKGRAFAAMGVTALLLLVLVAAGSWPELAARVRELAPGYESGLVRTAIVELVLSLILITLLLLGRTRLALLGLGLTIMPLTLQLRELAIAAGPYLSARELAAYIATTHPHASVFLYRDYESYGALPIYLRRQIPVIDSSSSDLYFGSRTVPSHPSLVDQRTALGSDEGLVVVRSEREETFRRSELGQRSRLVHRVARVSLYSVLPAPAAGTPPSAGLH